MRRHLITHTHLEVWLHPTACYTSLQILLKRTNTEKVYLHQGESRGGGMKTKPGLNPKA